ncbi:hypothetical protein GN958_ATG07276 [Phytophthora infestans]|uniref:Retrovirus-related Pol polyprotein from transposon TNT 1-94-like beta-barrel domain-containing protein n=1 Tax=Phytophthora infestans TaxID=4787 RepID=A0A8S9USW6_PHYIN|nr:hypothetical protein GN958_ATG07276 [Phytophthora infestans]
MLSLHESAPRFVRRYSSSSSSDDEDDGDFPMVGMVLRLNETGDRNLWMLGCGSSTHVCFDKKVYSSVKKSKATFKVWTGEITKGVMRGTVKLKLSNANGDLKTEMELNDVELSPAGTVNLFSLGKRESEGWTPSFSSAEVKPRKCWLDSAAGRLEFVKSGSPY